MTVLVELPWPATLRTVSPSTLWRWSVPRPPWIEMAASDWLFVPPTS